MGIEPFPPQTLAYTKIFSLRSEVVQQNLGRQGGSKKILHVRIVLKRPLNIFGLKRLRFRGPDSEVKSAYSSFLGLVSKANVRLPRVEPRE